MKIFLSYVIPGIMLLALALFAGAQRNPTLGLFGFLSFFVLAVTLIAEGIKKARNSKSNQERKGDS